MASVIEARKAKPEYIAVVFDMWFRVFVMGSRRAGEKNLGEYT
jgi:hypothetical protein